VRFARAPDDGAHSFLDGIFDCLFHGGFDLRPFQGNN
jgi:hypothetical protein